MTPALSPAPPVRERMPTLGEHTLVRALGAAPRPLGPLTADAARIWQEVAAGPGGAMAVLEICHRTRLGRGPVVMAVTELVRQSRARVSRPLQSGAAARLHDNVGTTYYDPELASAKLLVLGTERARFTAACGNGHAVQVHESCPVGPQEHLTMARIPLPGIDLYLLATPDPETWPTVWPGAVRDACGALVVATDQSWPQQGPLIQAARDHHLPLQVVIDHRHGPGPDLDALTGRFDLAPGQITLCDLDSSASTYAAVRDVVHRSSQQ